MSDADLDLDQLHDADLPPRLPAEPAMMTVGNFTFKFMHLQGLIVIEQKSFKDERGWFSETYAQDAFLKAGIPPFVQDNHSYSFKGVLRGLHFQKPTWQGKLVRVARGHVYDVAVDLRPESKTFGAWYGIELSDRDKRMMYVPEGFAHGFLALEDSEFLYKCTKLYTPGEEGTLLYNDPKLCIPWVRYAKDFGIDEFIISSKDIQNATTLEQYRFKNAGT